MTAYRTLLRPLLFRLDAELAHDRAIRTCEVVARLAPVRGLLARLHRCDDPRLSTTVGGLEFPNPVGLAAGPVVTALSLSGGTDGQGRCG